MLSLPLNIHSSRRSLRKQLSGTRGYSWKFLMRVYRLVLQILTIFQTKKCHFSHPFSNLGLGLFLESPGNFLDPESCFLFAAFIFKINVSIILKSNKMKLSVNEAKLTGLWAWNCATIKQVWILKCAFDPKSLLDFRETGPRPLRNYVIIT